MVAEPEPVHILLVDDEPKNLLALATVLEGTDRRLVRAGSGEEALRQLLHEDFAVILLDVHMPGIDGFDTAELIRGRDRSRDTPIIFLTAETRSDGFSSRGYSLGAVDYIVKPFDPDALRAKVAVFVELFRKTEEVKRQAAKLAETTTFLNGVLESATEYAIAALDAEGRFLTWNEGARRIYGYTADEMIGQRDLRALHLDTPEAERHVSELLRLAANQGKAECMLQHVRKGGLPVPVAATLSRRKHGDSPSIGFLLVGRDVTEQQQAEAQRLALIEEQAARSEAEAARDRLQQVVDVLPEGIVLVDARGEVYLSNAAADEIAGRPLTGSDGTTFADVGLFRLDGTPYPPDDLPLARIVQRGEVVRGEQLLVANADTGRQVPVLVNGAPLRDTTGTLVGGVMVFQDITPIKELETQKDAFLAAASHDLKNPLTAIKARAQILQRQAARIDDADGAKLADGLRAIDQTATRLTAMINELLDVARLQMGRPLLLDRQPTDLAELARQVAAELLPSSDRHEIVVEAQTAEATGPWDRARLERVLSNLVSNAIKFSPEGGEVRLVVRSEERHDGRWVALDVHDQGVGIPDDDVPRIFERFYRGSNVEGAIEGTGLGLAGARHIVEQHGGRLEVQSEQHHGSVFTVLLPVHVAPSGAEAAPAESDPVGAGAP